MKSHSHEWTPDEPIPDEFCAKDNQLSLEKLIQVGAHVSALHLAYLEFAQPELSGQYIPLLKECTMNVFNEMTKHTHGNKLMKCHVLANTVAAIISQWAEEYRAQCLKNRPT